VRLLVLDFLRNRGRCLQVQLQRSSKGRFGHGLGFPPNSFPQVGPEIQTPVTAVEGPFGFLGLD